MATSGRAKQQAGARGGIGKPKHRDQGGKIFAGLGHLVGQPGEDFSMVKVGWTGPRGKARLPRRRRLTPQGGQVAHGGNPERRIRDLLHVQWAEIIRRKWLDASSGM